MTQLPLTELWNDSGVLRAARRRHLVRDDIRDLLRRGPLVFVVANFGTRLEWIPLEDRFRFWKEVVTEHLVNQEFWCPDDFPGHFCFIAEEWIVEGSDAPVVVLEVSH